MQTEKRAGRVMRSVAAVLVIILAIVALFQGFRMRGKEALFRNVAVETENLPEEKQSGDDRAKIACEQGKEVTYQGEKYVYNEDLVSILFLGVDKEAFEEGGTVGDGKAGQADALFLLVLDTKTGKSRLIAISRDTMTDVNVYSDLGNFIGTEKLQLCLAYTYGDGKEKSCENTVRAVSRLFYGMPVAAYAALDLDAIAVLTDAVGGVEVTVTKDLTIQDPSLKEGERKVLTGEQAQWYVRSRLVEEKEATAEAVSCSFWRKSGRAVSKESAFFVDSVSENQGFFSHESFSSRSDVSWNPAFSRRFSGCRYFKHQRRSIHGRDLCGISCG